ncbi:DUF2922 domain-containing protein [Sporomusa sphaeroides DSM 2875]|uniref:DUF2922 domain-containing protein n=1 Tax=Sporomusa sphaeroides TaxID=47679 RepID=UPI00203013E4|nr:DUF2922 domain-containing protein [Sporomusa sphaeroides]MCM0760893.1 DUF2922 domain-containing protein [Sporomusa sphaeroides DSM 2875]
MDTKEVTRQYRLNKWTEIIRKCRSSGQTISVWCASHNIMNTIIAKNIFTSNSGDLVTVVEAQIR